MQKQRFFIGLNGIFVPEDADERTVYITADASVPEQSRVFYLRAQLAGNPTTQPVMLHVRRKKESPSARVSVP